MQISPNERLALGVAGLLLTLGLGARLLATEAPAAAWVGGSPAAQDSVAGLLERTQEAAAASQRGPLMAGERLDINQATAAELDRLPRVGPALAGRIVAHREEHGPFRTLDDLDAVSGVGPALLAAVAPHLDLRAAPAPPAVPTPPAAARGAAGATAASPAVLDVNRASAAELEALPGVGPVLAGRIVEWRSAHGRFRSVEELEQVPGIGPRLRERLAPRVRIAP